MNTWAIMRWQMEDRHVAQVSRVSDDVADVMATVSSATSFSDALSRARLLAKLNCAFQGERWARAAVTKALRILENTK